MWQHAKGELVWSGRPLIMGVVNVTPDSFSDGGRFLDAEVAASHALTLLGQGADLVDIGGESTRPGAAPVGVEEELRRVLPVIERVVRECPEAVISVDTSKGLVAREAVGRGAAIINDVSAGRWDSDMASAVVETGAGYVVMHARSRPQTMQEGVSYADVVEEVEGFLVNQLRLWGERGVAPCRLVVDPGIGFGKLVEHNLALIRAAPRLAELGRPVLWGLSRKSFIGKITGAAEVERLPGTLAAHGWAMAAAGRQALQIWRVHDVAETMQFLKIWQALEQGQM